MPPVSRRGSSLLPHEAVARFSPFPWILERLQKHGGAPASVGRSSKRGCIESPSSQNGRGALVLLALGATSRAGSGQTRAGISWMCDRAIAGVSWGREGACSHPWARGAGMRCRVKAEQLQCFCWPGSLLGGSRSHICQTVPRAAPGISQVQVYLHCPVVLNHSKVASCFLAIMIPFFLSYAFHLEILEAFNW